MAPPHVLIVDDDPHLREMLRYALSREGLRVSEAPDGVRALALFAADPADLIVLDVLMPEMDGLELCRRLRSGAALGPQGVSSTVPIIFLSSKGEEFDRVLGLELGGDDYLAKPFSVRELVSRVRAVLRRARPQESSQESQEEQMLSLGLLRLDPARHRCFAGEHEVELTVTELRLLRVLMGRPGRVFTREELTERAWDEPHFIADRTVDSHIRRIRQKLRDAGIDPIETVHGLGFRVVSP